ncbi:MAG: metallophosphatase family protein [Candidatus Omnitrophica bacterium]|nr:metallophosphatase family protein [Candidatus Omnitrophota bacterium]MBU4488589.1 metallophosphatase family protein [Candidatus Omnitrophota bacterium]MCG2704469.1 metallophosphatase family protein [Candidatus Omnitrophota bacterium]
MRYGIFSDVHSNGEAFQTVITSLKEENIDIYICIGDIVGYGAEPSDCIDLTRKITDKVVAGNHDWASAGILTTSYFNDFAKEAIEWTSKRLVVEEKEYLKALSLVYEDENITAVHGSLNEPEEFHYILDTSQALATFGLMKGELCFIGHSHLPLICAKGRKGVAFLPESEVKIEKGARYIINVGSVGQPRDGDPRASYAVFDTEKSYAEIKRAPYDVKKAAKKIIDAGLPPVLAARLNEGR